ncbi:MAG: hypothetical protein ACI9F9_000863 [Candidatus Paceibacteria bacterium]|jgi:hypothetical protein
MRGVNVAKYTFDFDLTFACLALSPEGRVFGRYGGRDARGASHWTNEGSFMRMLQASLRKHRADQASPTALEVPNPLTPERIPAFAKRDKGSCIHCHNVHEGLQHQARAEGAWKPADIWVYPPPERIGLDLDVTAQRLVVSVLPASPAASAGILAGDFLTRIGPHEVSNATDVMAALHSLGSGPVTTQLAFQRGRQTIVGKLSLPATWKVGTPEQFAWRALKWTLDPVPGFGGPALESAERKKHKLPEGQFAFKINYFVTWGPRAYSGRAATRAGLRKGDIVLKVAGKADFQSVEHFHAWWRLTREVGEVVEIGLIRGRQRVRLDYPVAAPTGSGD